MYNIIEASSENPQCEMKHLAKTELNHCNSITNLMCLQLVFWKTRGKMQTQKGVSSTMALLESKRWELCFLLSETITVTVSEIALYP